jgi:hypothetical protein
METDFLDNLLLLGNLKEKEIILLLIILNINANFVVFSRRTKFDLEEEYNN